MKNTSVLIVGAGPTGLAMAIELARYGISFRIIDSLSEPSPWSRALGIQARTLELFERYGIADKLLKEGLKVDGVQIFYKNELIASPTVSDIPSHHPYILITPQSVTERVMTDCLKELGGKIEFSSQLKHIEMLESGVKATIHAAHGQEVIEADYLIACDGAKSFVRSFLKIPFEGSTFDGHRFALIDCEIQGDIRRDKVSVYLDQGYIIAFFPLKNRSFRIVVEAPASDKRWSHEQVDLSVFQEFFDERLPFPLKLLKHSWISVFSVHQRLVPQCQHGRIFLLGDAAHIHSPIGGQGMNTGIQDAINLGWKLAQVIQGQSSEKLLLTFNQERYPIMQSLERGTKRSSILLFLKNPFLIQLRNWVLKKVSSLRLFKENLPSYIAQLKQNYRKSSLSVNQGGEGVIAGDRMPDIRLGEEKHLYDCFKKPGWHLVLFLEDPLAPTDIESLGDVVKGKPISLHVYSFAGECGDLKKEIKTKLKVSTSSLYLVRPDGYVGLCQSPPHFEALSRYLSAVFLSD